MLYSNGLLITNDFLDRLEKRGICPSIQFSFDGVGWHDWMRGVPGAEKAVVDALRRCYERGIPTSAAMVLFKENKDSIRDSVNLMASLGCRALKINNASPQGEWKNQKEHYLAQEEAYEAYLEYIPHYFEDGTPLSISLDGFFTYENQRRRENSFYERNIPEERFSKSLICGHVRRELYVSPKGNILPCMALVGGPLEENFPNMLEVPLEEILDSDSLYMDFVNLRVSDFMEHNPECRECEFRTECCGGCRAIAVRDNPTDYLAKDMTACSYYKDGWKERKDNLLLKLFQ